MRAIGIVALFIFQFFSCSNKEEIASVSDYPDLSIFFKNQAEKLDSLKPEYKRMTLENNEPTDELSDTLVWSKELTLFNRLNLSGSSLTGRYDLQSDTVAGAILQFWSARDSSLEVRKLVLRLEKGEISMVEGTLVKQGFIVDRVIHLAYQTMKGYSIQIWEDYIWSRPRKREVFNQIEDPQGLWQ